MDYFFLGGEDMAAAQNPMFVMTDEDKGNRYARLIEHKGLDGGNNDWLIMDAANEGP